MLCCMFFCLKLFFLFLFLIFFFLFFLFCLVFSLLCYLDLSFLFKRRVRCVLIFRMLAFASFANLVFVVGSVMNGVSESMDVFIKYIVIVVLSCVVMLWYMSCVCVCVNWMSDSSMRIVVRATLWFFRCFCVW